MRCIWDYESGIQGNCVNLIPRTYRRPASINLQIGTKSDYCLETTGLTHIYRPSTTDGSDPVDLSASLQTSALTPLDY